MVNETTNLEGILKTIKDAKLDIELLRRDNEKKCMENNIKINELEAIIGRAEEGLWCAYRVMPDNWEYDIPKLINWAKDDDDPQEPKFNYRLNGGL